ncbi:MAG: hypothetical protein MJ214_03020 [Bacilli bacterium]|nr:hypothetical protein [Bacilli bacterium]
MSTTGIIISVICIVLVLFLIVFWIVTQYSNRRYASFIKNSVNSVRSVVIDLNKQQASFFNRTKLRYVRTVPLERYYWQFSKRDAKKLNDWFNELMKKNTQVENSCDVEVRLHRARRYYRSLLQVVNIDYNKKIINLDSYLFLKLSRHRLSLLGEDSNNKIKLTVGNRGYTANFHFTAISLAGNKGKISRLLYLQLKEIAAGMLSSGHRVKEMIDTGENEFAIIDFRSIDRNEGLNYIHKVNNQMRKFLEINGNLNRVNISVGLVSNSYYRHNLKKIIEKAKAMSEIAYQKNTLIITYSKNMKNDLEEDKFDSEIEQIIKKKQIAYNFESVYGIKRERIIGYISLPTPIDTSAKTMSELYTRSVKTGENKQLLNVVLKDSITAFSSGEHHDTVLFRHLRFNETENFLNAMRNVAKNINQAVIFDEYDISYSANEDKEFVTKIKKYQERKIDVCLALSDKSLILDHKIYALFDYFFVYTNEVGHKRDESTNLAIRAIIEKLLKYGKPIILANVDSWSTIELFIRSGVEYIASPVITPISDKLLEPASKTKAKIKRMID